MPVYIGGAELNVATALACWKVPVTYCTTLPENYLSKEIIRSIQERGIQTDRLFFSGERIGTYFLPQGADLKHAGVIYDRAGSSFWQLKPGQIDWDEQLEGITWFHFSAISPALNEHTAAVCLEAVMAARKKGITVSVDLNYRARLWQYGKLPGDIMPELVRYCDVVMGNLWAAEQMLGIPIDEKIEANREAYLEQALHTSEALIRHYEQCTQVALTFRFDAEAGVRYYASLYTGGSLFSSPERTAATIVDKVGTGDTFMAGLIYGSVQNLEAQERIDFAAAAAFNKFFEKGDATRSTIEDIRKNLLHYA
jgi:2-dehydro-3-deoxygluconokinase